MPSGAKKRKAAKKKKEKEANNSSSTHSHGDDDLKVHDGKESDGGDTGSPASQDHYMHQDPFTEGDGEEMENREDTSSIRSIVTESEPMVEPNSNRESTQEMAKEGDNVIQIDWELKPEDDSDENGKNVTMEHVEPVKESHRGSSSSSSSSSTSSSDDESHVVEKNIVVIESGESKEDAPPYSVTETAPLADSVTTSDMPGVTKVTDGVPIIEAYDFAVGEPKEETYEPVAAHAFAVNLVDTADLPEGTLVKDSVPNIGTFSLVVEEPSNSVVEIIPPVNSEIASKEVVHVNNSATAVNPTCSSDSGFVLKENGKNESSGVSPVVMETGSQPVEDKVAPTAVECSAGSTVAQEDEDILILSSNVPTDTTSNGAELIKDSVVTECSDSQPLVALAPRPVKTTSLNSCCGLFELFTGSSR